MEAIEIRQRKKLMVPFISVFVFVFVLLGVALGIFFMEKYKDATRTKISFVVGVVVFFYFAYRPIKK